MSPYDNPKALVEGFANRYMRTTDLARRVFVFRAWKQAKHIADQLGLL